MNDLPSAHELFDLTTGYSTKPKFGRVPGRRRRPKGPTRFRFALEGHDGFGFVAEMTSGPWRNWPLPICYFFDREPPHGSLLPPPGVAVEGQLLPPLLVYPSCFTWGPFRCYEKTGEQLHTRPHHLVPDHIDEPAMDLSATPIPLPREDESVGVGDSIFPDVGVAVALLRRLGVTWH